MTTAPEAPFDEPWQAKAFALALAATTGQGLPWSTFQAELIAAIGEDPDRPYWESWVVALERHLGVRGAA